MSVVTFDFVDSITYSSKKDTIFSDFLLPLNDNFNNLIAFDEIDQNIIFFDSTHAIINYLDVKNLLAFDAKFINSYFGAVISEDTIILLSNNGLYKIDKRFNFLSKINYDMEIMDVEYYKTGGWDNSCFDFKRQRIYVTVAPKLSPKNPDTFNLGRILEIDLSDGSMRLLPLGLPEDYKGGVDYKLFSIPNITLIGDQLFCIYPVSTILYSYNVTSFEVNSAKVEPGFGNIKEVEISNNPKDMFHEYLENDSFYKIITNENVILLFYWKGKQRNTFNRSKGLEELDCYILGIEPISMKFIFDTKIISEGAEKKALMYYNSNIIFRSNRYNANKIQTTFKFYKIGYNYN